MDQYLPPPGIPCPHLKVGQCPNGDGCKHAHDFIAQPCFSAAQIDFRMRSLEDARPANRYERARIKRRKDQLRRLGARKLAAPGLIERGIVPTKKAIKHELGRYIVGPPNKIAPPAARERVFVGGGEDDGGEWQTSKANFLRRRKKMLARMRQQNASIHAISRSSDANGNPPTKAELRVGEGAPGIGPPSAGGASSGCTTARGNMNVDEEMEPSRRVEIVGDFTVKHPISIPLHLRHRYPNASLATMNTPPPPNQPPYTDEGIIYAPLGEIVQEIEKEHVAKRNRALSF